MSDSIARPRPDPEPSPVLVAADPARERCVREPYLALSDRAIAADARKAAAMTPHTPGPWVADPSRKAVAVFAEAQADADSGYFMAEDEAIEKERDQLARKAPAKTTALDVLWGVCALGAIVATLVVLLVVAAMIEARGGR